MVMVPLKTIEILQWQQNVVLKVQRFFNLALSLQIGLGTEMIWRIHLFLFFIIKCIHQKMGYVAIASFFRSFKRAKTIVDHRTRIWGNH